MSASRRSFRCLAPLSIAAGLLGGALGGCAKDAPAGLQLAFGTDLIVPDDVNAVALVVTDAARGTLIGAPIVNPTVPSAEGRAVRFPATVALETAFVEDGYTFAGRGATRAVERVQIALIGLKGATADEATRSGAAVTLRRVVTTMPRTGVHLLRMSLDYLDTGGALGSAASLGIAPNSAPRAGLAPLHLRLADAPFGDVRSACPSEDEDLVAGRCVKVREVDGQSLPDFTAAAVYGGGASGTSADATCFDAPTCFADLTPVPVDSAGRATGPWKSFAVVRHDVLLSADSNASCVGTGAARRCVAVLDGDEPGAPGAYRVEGGSVVFDPGVLAALAAGKITGIVGSSCAKTPATPLCGPWSSVQNASNRYAPDAGPPPAPSADATVDGGRTDSGLSDGGSSDGGSSDGGSSDGGSSDGGSSDGGRADAGPPNPRIFPSNAGAPLGAGEPKVSDFAVDPQGDTFAIRGGGAPSVVLLAPNGVSTPFVSPPLPGDAGGRLAVRDFGFFFGVRATPPAPTAGVALWGFDEAPNSLFALETRPAYNVRGFARGRTAYAYGPSGVRRYPAATGEEDVAAGVNVTALAVWPPDARALLATADGKAAFFNDNDGALAPAPTAITNTLLRGAVGTAQGFYVTYADAQGLLVVAPVTAAPAPTLGAPIVLGVPAAAWDPATADPAPGLAALPSGAGPSSNLFVATADGLAVVNTAQGFLGFAAYGPGADLRRVQAENGCVTFAKWSDIPLQTSRGPLYTAPGVHRICF